MKTTATAGIILPNPTSPALETAPPHLTLVQFIQTMFVGLSGLKGEFVIPSYQPEPPKQPDISVDWLAFAIGSIEPDNNAFIGFTNTVDPDDSVPILQRNELLQVSCSFYGPNSYNMVGLVRDGFQLTQNIQAMRTANVIFAYDTPARRLPDLINGRWCDRYVTDIFMRRQVVRSYPLLSFASAEGTIHSQTSQDEDFTQNFDSGS